jgi:hypothetical protein
MAECKDLSSETLLRRNELADALTRAGYPTATATLATKAVRGGGPPFRYFGRFPLYAWGDGLAWARSRLSPPVASTSEATALLPGQAT